MHFSSKMPESAYFMQNCDNNIVVAFMKTPRKLQTDDINSEIIGYIDKHRKANAGELAAFVGITVPSIRYRIFQLMAKGIVGQEKARDHRVWWFLQKNEKDEFERMVMSNE
jgi:hypothetical protein